MLRRRARRCRPLAALLAGAALLAACALGACRSESRSYEEGLVEGGRLTPVEKAAYHYDTAILPPGSEMYSALSPEVVETEEGRLRKIVTYSETYSIDRVVPAMVGPRSAIYVDLKGDPERPEIVWIKGIHAEIVDELGNPVSQEFMCHLVASIQTIDERDRRLGLVTTDRRFAALAQGYFHKQYPEGFGLPVLSTDQLAFASQVLNYSVADAAQHPIRVRHKVVTTYIRGSELARPLRALTSTYAQAMVLLDGQEGEGYFGVRVPDEEIHGASCAVGRAADGDVDPSVDQYGRRYTPHWVVEPGPMTNQTLVTKMLKLKYDTTIHVIDVHLHPFGEWIELRDLTTQETLFRAEAEQREDAVGLARVQSYVSREGIPVHADHEYALVTHYDNTSGTEQDAMALVYVGLLDKEFEPGLLTNPVARARLREEREQRALARLERAVGKDPQDPLAQYQLGVALLHRKRFEEAAEHFRIAAHLDPDDDRPRRGLARALDRLP